MSPERGARPPSRRDDPERGARPPSRRDDPEPGVLAQTLSADFAVGSNTKGTANGNWPFLLPRLRVGTVVCYGTLALASLRTLSRMATEVVLCPPSRPNRAVVEHARREGLANVCTGELSALGAGAINVAWLGTRPSPTLLDTLDRVLHPHGVLFSERPGRHLRSRFPQRTELWTAPRRRHVQLAVPAAAAPAIAWAQRGGLAAAARGRWARRLPVALPVTRRTALVARDGGTGGSLPAYVLQIAGDAGVPLDGRAWVFSAPGRYASKKILFFVFDAAGERPEVVVRLTRAAAFNSRLENEWRALCRLQQLGVTEPETVPQPRFFGYHEGLAVLGETALEGVPFQERSSARPDCSYGRAAIGWLVDLGVRTADRSSAGAGEISAAVSAVHDRFTGTYTLSQEHRRALAGHVAALGASGLDLPTVHQHGDPGTWNLLVTSAGGIGILDWEAYEHYGMPLWDLFYFMRSYGVWAARARGRRDQLDGFARQFFTDSPLNALLTGAVSRFCQHAGLTRELVEPLFFTCWMHRALKEATRLQPQRLDNGHFVQLLRRCLDERDSPGLRRLFAAGA